MWIASARNRKAEAVVVCRAEAAKSSSTPLLRSNTFATYTRMYIRMYVMAPLAMRREETDVWEFTDISRNVQLPSPRGSHLI
jgi:hypothetical protein